MLLAAPTALLLLVELLVRRLPGVLHVPFVAAVHLPEESGEWHHSRWTKKLLLWTQAPGLCQVWDSCNR